MLPFSASFSASYCPSLAVADCREKGCDANHRRRPGPRVSMVWPRCGSPRVGRAFRPRADKPTARKGQIEMGIGEAGAVKGDKPQAQADTSPSAESVKEFNEALGRSAGSKHASSTQAAVGTAAHASGGKPMIVRIDANYRSKSATARRMCDRKRSAWAFNPAGAARAADVSPTAATTHKCERQRERPLRPLAQAFTVADVSGSRAASHVIRPRFKKVSSAQTETVDPL
jgi:hypothetical protein